MDLIIKNLKLALLISNALLNVYQNRNVQIIVNWTTVVLPIVVHLIAILNVDKFVMHNVVKFVAIIIVHRIAPDFN
ncbi:MAG: hypothetical protein NTX05_00075 [Fusobacteria bacterium]|nr:hypothetical protein [Fusobacteriota bacterium]